MKKVYRSFSSLKARICAAAIALIGFGCESDGGKDLPAMYGTPYGNYKIKGSVTNQDGSPVTGASIRVTEEDIPSGKYTYSNTTTNNEGEYQTDGKAYTSKLKVVCIPDNPALDADSTIVPVKYVPDGKGDGWSEGSAEATVNFTLKKK